MTGLNVEKVENTKKAIKGGAVIKKWEKINVLILLKPWARGGLV